MTVAIATALVAGCIIYRPVDPEVKELQEQRERGTVVRELDVSMGAAEKIVERALENLEIELGSIKDHDSHLTILGSSERRRAEVKVVLEAQREYSTRMEVNARKWTPEHDDTEGDITISPQGDTTLVIGASVRQQLERWDKGYAIEIADDVERLLEEGSATANLP